MSSSSAGASYSNSRVSPSSKARRQTSGQSCYSQGGAGGPARAQLSWKKVNPVEEEEREKKKGKKPCGGKKEDSEDSLEFLEEIPPEKVFACAVNLAEINRKLGVVMWKPPA